MGNIQIQARSATTDLTGIAVAGYGALIRRGRGGEVANNDTAPTLAAILSAGERKAGVLAGTQADLGGHGGRVDIVHRIGEGAAAVRVVGVAAQGDVVCNGRLLRGERGVLPDIDQAVPSACLR